jgi:hypothetical protein
VTGSPSLPKISTTPASKRDDCELHKIKNPIITADNKPKIKINKNKKPSTFRTMVLKAFLTLLDVLRIMILQKIDQ